MSLINGRREELINFKTSSRPKVSTSKSNVSARFVGLNSKYIEALKKFRIIRRHEEVIVSRTNNRYYENF